MNDGTTLPTASIGTYFGFSKSSTVLPDQAGASPFVGGYLIVNGYALAAVVDANYYNLGGIGFSSTTGFSPSPGTNYYLWVSADSRATWSVHRDSGNVPLPFKVIG